MMSKKHAYLIMAHNHWKQLEILLKCIDHPQNDIYLHIDKNVREFPEQELKEAVKKSKLLFVKRYKIAWGSPKAVKCIINLLKSASVNHYEYYHLLSGVDLPIVSQDEIHAFFAANQGKQYVGFDWDGIQKQSFLIRAQYYYLFSGWLGKGPHRTKIKRALSTVQELFIVLQKKLGVNRLKKSSFLYKGSEWFSISDDLVSAIVSDSKRIIKKYLFTLGADELWLQNYVFLHGWSDRLAENNARFIMWRQGDPSPLTITAKDSSEMLQSKKLFARKFDDEVDKEVIDFIYHTVLSKE